MLHIIFLIFSFSWISGLSLIRSSGRDSEQFRASEEEKLILIPRLTRIYLLSFLIKVQCGIGMQ
jgi:hypothetical protein